MQITPDGITLAVRPEAKGSQVKKVLSCLTGEKSIITGTLDVQGDLAGRGRASDIGRTLSGPVTITCRKGRIYKSNLFTKILSFLSIRSLLSGRVSDITRKGFAYRLLEIHGEVQGNTFIVRDAILDSDPLALACKGSINLQDKTLDLTALATPFQIPDIGLKAVPFIGTLFSKKHIGVPIKISGNIEDAKLSPGLPDAIGKDLVRVVKKIVKLPVHIIDLPVLLFENKKEEKSKQ